MDRTNCLRKSCLNFFGRLAGLVMLFVILCLTEAVFLVPARAETANFPALVSDPALSPATTRTPITSIRVAVWNRGGRFDYGTDGALTGYDAELVGGLSEYLDLPVEYVPVSGPAQALSFLDQGKLNLITSMRRTDEREQTYLYSGLSSGFTYSGLIALKSREDLIFGDTTAFQKAAVGYEGSSGSRDSVLNYLHNTCHVASPQPFDSVDTLRMALHSGAVDLMATGANNVDEDEKIVARFAPEEVYFLTSKENFQLMDQVDAFLTHLTINVPDYLSTLQNRYFPMYANTEFTKDELDFIAASSTITVGIPVGRCPISYVDPYTGEFSGIAVDLMNQLSQTTGLVFQYMPIPSGMSVQEALQENKCDIVLPTIDESRYQGELPLYISDSIMDANVTIATSDIKKLTGKTALHLGVSKELLGLANFLRSEYPEHTITQYENQQEAIKALRSGEIDAIVNNLYVLSYLLQDPHYGDLTISPSVSVTMPYCIAGRKDRNSSLLFTVLDKGIHSLSDTDKNASIIKYTSSRLYEYTFMDYVHMERLPLSIGGVVLLCALGAAILLSLQKNRYYRSVAAANESLKKANMAKTDFLSRMSHDIRTPMNAIIGISILGAADTTDTASAREFQKIQIAGNYLLGLINDLLDMRTIEEGKIQLHESDASLPELRETVLQVLKPLLEERNMTLDCTGSDCPKLVVRCDPLRLAQIHESILGNAIKFSPPGSRVEWNIANQMGPENQIMIREVITDHGCGMSKEFLKKAFLPFEQEMNVYSYERPGTGLGLAVCKSIMDQMGGEISVESELNQGTKVTLSYQLTVVGPIPEAAVTEFPTLKKAGAAVKISEAGAVAVDTPAADTSVADTSVADTSTADTSTADKLAEGSLAADNLAPGKLAAKTESVQTSPSTESPLHGCQLLMCEDHPVNREIAKRILEKRGVIVSCAENGQEGVDAFRQSEPGFFQLILMDIKMPVMDGLEATRQIRSLERPDATGIPIIALTANAYESDKKNCLEAGMNAHLAKPINPAVLYETLEQYLS